MAHSKRQGNSMSASIRKSRRLEAQAESTAGSIVKHSTSANKEPSDGTPARTAVFCTTELLEHILVHLHTLDILIAQRTCKAFQDAVKDSVAIQRKLFFVADTPDQRWMTGSPMIKTGCYCSLYPDYKEEHMSDGTTLLLKPVRLNPLLSITLLQRPEWWNRNFVTFSHSSQGLTGSTRNASWRKMYISDPPVHSARASIGFAAPGRSISKFDVTVTCGNVDQEPGEEQAPLTLGDVVDAAITKGHVAGKNWGVQSRYGFAWNLGAMEAKEGAAHIPAGLLHLHLPNTIVPPEEQWLEMRRKHKVALVRVADRFSKAPDRGVYEWVDPGKHCERHLQTDTSE